LVLHHELYASVSLVIACLYLILQHFAISGNVSVIISLVTGYLIRMVAVRAKWRLPVFRLLENAK
ncbi:trimeric intracellular cation channel family protein, partial [Psychrobacter faecalis]